MIRLAESQYLRHMGLRDLYRFARTLWHWTRLNPRPAYFPEFLWIETTNACNLRCRMCPQSLGEGRPAGRMDDSLYASLLDQAAGRCYGLFLFLGGDPLCDPAYPERVRQARARGLRVFVHTNATLLDAEKSERLLDAEPTTVSLSLDTADSERYEHWRAGASYEETFEKVRLFLRAARARRVRPLTLVQLIDVDGSGARDEAELRRRLGPDLPDLFRLRPLHDWAGDLAPALGGTANPQHPYFPCLLLWKALVVLWDGTAAACCNDLSGKVKLGNARETPLHAIWTGEPMVRLRETLIAGQHLPALCRRCVNLHHPFGHSPLVRLARRLLGRRQTSAKKENGAAG